ncbi:MAG: carbohydrate ABC transporter permease [Chloroflexota bacterium]
MIAEKAVSYQAVRPRHRPWRLVIPRIVTYLLVALGGAIFMFPFYWAVMSSGKTPTEIASFPPTLWPQNMQFVENYAEVFRVAPFGRWIWNSVVITALSIVGTILSCSVAAYAFARFRFRGRDLWFLLMLSTMMIPSEVLLIPTYLIFKQLGWVNSIKPLVVPSWFGGSAFTIFLIRQFYLGIPRDMDEAAYIDGASSLRIFLTIILPLAKPAIATGATLQFIGSWNSFLGPLIYLNKVEKFTAVIGLRYFALGTSSAQAASGPPRDNLVMACSVIVALPCLILFFAAQKYFVQGIATTGIKG